MEGTQQSATIGATAITILGANAHRRKLTISPPSAGRVTLAFNATAVLDQGQTIQTGTQAITWTREDLGDLIRGPISAIADAPGRIVGIMEGFEPNR